jgi:hypothetical protein
VDALLDFSRMGRSAIKPSLVDTTALVEDLVAEMKQQERGRRIEWDLRAPLPRLWADPLLLQVALRNLLGNAVKYSRGREPARIRVEAAATPDGLGLEITDNGGRLPDEVRRPSCSACSSACTAARTSTAPASAWPTSSASSRGTAARSGPAANRTTAPPSASCSRPPSPNVRRSRTDNGGSCLMHKPIPAGRRTDPRDLELDPLRTLGAQPARQRGEIIVRDGEGDARVPHRVAGGLRGACAEGNPAVLLLGP